MGAEDGDATMPAASARDPLIVDGLSARLGGFQLGALSFRVEPAQVTALLGHNGAGKTTTLRLIMGLVRKDFGQVSLGGLDHVRDEIEFKRRIGFAQEEGFFYNAMTVAEFCAFVAPFYSGWNEALAWQLLRTLELPADKKLGQLSKGMRTKSGLVAALAHQPGVVLLDEPTSGLDPRARVETLKLMQRAAHEGGAAVLFSTHNLYEVEQIADRLIVVDQGRVVAEEGLAALRRGARSPWSLERYYLELVR
jgi:ABC-2 type transport system ATP-binding protein